MDNSSQAQSSRFSKSLQESSTQEEQTPRRSTRLSHQASKGSVLSLPPVDLSSQRFGSSKRQTPQDRDSAASSSRRSQKKKYQASSEEESNSATSTNKPRLFIGNTSTSIKSSEPENQNKSNYILRRRRSVSETNPKKSQKKSRSSTSSLTLTPFFETTPIDQDPSSSNFCETLYPMETNKEDEDVNSETSASNRIQGILQQLGLGSLMGGEETVDAARIQSILEGLQAVDNECQQMEAVIELCDLLSLATEDTLANFRMNETIKAVVALLSLEHNPDIMLYATRALAYMLEASLSYSSQIISAGAVPSLCAKLLNIAYIDLAEQCIKVLEKLSVEKSTKLLQEGAIMALLQFLDFFSLATQRSAMIGTTNMCQRVIPSNFHLIQDCLPILSNLMVSYDEKVVLYALQSICFICENCSSDEKLLLQVVSHGVLQNCMQIVNLDSPALWLVLKLVNCLANGSVTISSQMLEFGIANHIGRILSGVSTTESTENHSSTVPETDPCYQALSLINNLLPQLPASMVPIATLRGRYVIPQTPPALKIQSSNTVSNSKSQREIMLTEKSEMVFSMGDCLFPKLVTLYTTRFNQQLRHICLHDVIKILHFSTPAMLEEILRNQEASAFVASLLASNDLTVVDAALQMAEILMRQLPDIFGKFFRREGVMFAIEKLASIETLQSGGEFKGGIVPPTSPISSESSESSNSSHPDELLSPVQHSISPFSTEIAMKKRIKERAIKFREAYCDPHKFGDKAFTTEQLLQLKDLGSVLLNTNASGREDLKLARKALEEISRLLTEGEGISTFEVLFSGIVFALDVFLGQKACKMSNEDILSRWNLFRDVFATNCDSAMEESRPIINPLNILIRHIQKGISQQENFVVSVSDIPTMASGLKLLTQPIKLRLKREETCGMESLGSYSHDTMVLIEPLAQISAIEEFLKRRICGTPFAKSPIGGVAASYPPPGTTRLGNWMRKRQETKLGDHTANSEVAARFSSSSRPIPKSANQNIPVGKKKSNLMQFSQLPEEETEDDPMELSHGTLFDEGTSDGDADGDADADEDDDDEDDEHSIVVQNIRLSSPQVGSPLTGSTPPKFSSNRLGNTPLSHMTSPRKILQGTGRSYRPRSDSNSSVDNSLPSIVFSLNGHDLNTSTSVFQCLQKYQRLPNSRNYDCTPGGSMMSLPIRWMWDQDHVIYFRVASPAEIIPNDTNIEESPCLQKNTPLIKQQQCRKACPFESDVFANAIRDSLSLDITADREEDNSQLLTVSSSSIMHNTTVQELIHLLHMIEIFCRMHVGWDESKNGKFVSSGSFVNSQLTAKIQRQLQDPMSICSGTLPSWCSKLTTNCPYLFPFDSKKLYFTCTAMGIARGLHAIQDLPGAKSVLSMSQGREKELRIGRIQRLKVRVARERIIDSAVKVMELYGQSKAVLEVEYFGEVGTGLGPTLEFYTLVCQALQERSLNMWLDGSPTKHIQMADDQESLHVFHPSGLFPKPINPQVENIETKAILDRFSFMGTFVAKAILDGRLLDLALSYPFLKWMSGKALDYSDYCILYPEQAKIIAKLLDIARQVDQIQSADAAEATKLLDTVTYDGVKLEDLSIHFTLPGDPTFELCPGGADILLDLSNVKLYVNSILENCIENGVRRQFDAFERGFNKVFSMASLRIFNFQQLETIIGGHAAGIPWCKSMLLEAISASHGFSVSSKPVQYLMEVMSEFSSDLQRKFLTFVTGSARLPVGGFKDLKPKLTVVLKGHTPPLAPDDYLPSVMTCANYIKLPDYSSLEITRARILVAITDGQHSFNLS